MFQLENQKVAVRKVTVITGNTNDEDGSSGITLSCEAQVGGDIVDAFNKDLRSSFFRKQRKGDQMDLDKSNEGLVMLKFPVVEFVQWEEDFTGYEAEVSSDGLFDASLFFADVKLRMKSFRFVEGGTTIVRFNLNIYPEKPLEKGELADLQKRDALITLKPPTAQAEDLPEAA